MQHGEFNWIGSTDSHDCHRYNECDRDTISIQEKMDAFKTKSVKNREENRVDFLSPHQSTSKRSMH